MQRPYDEIIIEEMKEFANLVIKYSPSQLVEMVMAVDLDNLQLEMIDQRATKDELRASSECYNDIHEMMKN